MDDIGAQVIARNRIVKVARTYLGNPYLHQVSNRIQPRPLIASNNDPLGAGASGVRDAAYSEWECAATRAA
jgi:hypothetical protein